MPRLSFVRAPDVPLALEVGQMLVDRGQERNEKPFAISSKLGA